MWASRHGASVARAQAHRGFPAEGLGDCRLCFEPPWPVSTALGWGAVRPGARTRSAPGRGVAGCGGRPLAAPRRRGRCRGNASHGVHGGSGGVNAGEGPPLGYHGDGRRARHAAQGLQRFGQRVKAPGLARRVALLIQPLEPCGGLGNRPHVFLEGEVWRRWGPADRGAPAQVGRGPGGPAGVAQSVPPQDGFAPALGGLERAGRLFTRPSARAGLHRRP
jgi:hypothetical protein